MMNCEILIRQIIQLDAVTRLDIRLVEMLRIMQTEPALSDSAVLVLYIYFSMLDDGNTRIPLDAEKLSKSWIQKWNRICMNKEDLSEIQPLDESVLTDLIKPGIASMRLRENGYRNIICSAEERKANTYVKPLVVDHDDYLYAIKYYDAKCMIENQFKNIFKPSEDKRDADDLSSLREVLKSTAPELAELQKEAILRGLNDNLIITGGPGTGKTMVICYLLWMLLNQLPEDENWEICLSAPSGKAADRMRESIMECLNDFDLNKVHNNCKTNNNDKMNQIYNKLLYQESMTIHRLLKYNPANNQFTYNADNRFPNHTIFVIDEASMIDIDLFAKFMEALPEDRSKYRLYILGDPYQLPSVEAGAVLGEVLESAPDSKVELDVSYRFRSDSEIGKLAGVIKEMASHPEMNIKPNREFVLLPDKVWFRPETCQYYMLVPDAGQDSLSHKERKARLEARTKALNSLVKQWCECFYSHLIEMASRIDPVRLAENMPDPETLDQLGALWKIADSARLLSAEKNGLLGTGSLNALVRGFLMERLGADCPDHPDLKSHFFTGQILMLARNQNMLKLYNGDTGIVIGEKNTGRKYLLLQKSSRSRDGDVIVPYTLYALSLLPEESLESAFAMTIHKSQGSGYENIMMFLPENPGHPLLNNQIVYTGVTRTKNGSLTIVSNHDAFEYACKTVIRRDTGIVVSS